MLSLYLFTTLFTNFLLITKKWLCTEITSNLFSTDQLEESNEISDDDADEDGNDDKEECGGACISAFISISTTA